MSMTLRLTEEQDRMLTDLADRQGISKQETVIRAITERSSRLSHEERVRIAAREVIARDSSLLARLAE